MQLSANTKNNRAKSYKRIGNLLQLSPEIKNTDLDRFFKLSPDLFCVSGFDGYFKKVNPSFEQMLGYTKVELLSQPFMNFVVNEEHESTSGELNSIKQGVSNTNFENRYRCKDGSIKWLSWRSVSIPEEQLIYAIARDVTQEKNREALLRAQAECLKEAVINKNESLNYGLLLQKALFHDPKTLNRIFPESFIYHSAKDILSGDFYWFEKISGKAFVACADCTGHGVPGAMLSVLGINKLHEIISSLEFPPSKILNKLNEVICRALGKKYSDKEMNDGMDISLFSVDFETNLLNFSGANNPLFIVRNGSLFELKADKQSVGNFNQNSFTDKSFQLMKDDMIYSFSDGYADQFGGPKGKKFMRKNFKKLLVSIAGKSAEVQKELLAETLKVWKNNYEQTDDICVIGVRITS